MGYLRSYERKAIRDFLATAKWNVPTKNNLPFLTVHLPRGSGKRLQYETLNKIMNLDKPTILKCWFEKVLHVLHLDKR